MNEWELAALIVILALVPCLWTCLRAGAPEALAAVEVGGALGCSALMLLAEGFHRQPFVDLAVVLALGSTVGALVFARMMESEELAAGENLGERHGVAGGGR
jgi:multisubunit Na+/H+ antiporter MnhF subunit